MVYAARFPVVAEPGSDLPGRLLRQQAAARFVLSVWQAVSVQRCLRTQRRAHNRLSKFPLRGGQCPSDGSESFSPGYLRWLHSLRLPSGAQARALTDYIAEVLHQDARVKGLEADLAELVQTMPQTMQRVMAALRCLHGIALLRAATTVAEAGEMSRFRKARQLFSDAGLVPSEHRSGQQSGQSRDGITTIGSGQLRHILVEVAWHYQKRPSVSAKLLKRRQGQDPRILAIADQTHQRRYHKFLRLEPRGKGSAQPGSPGAAHAKKEAVTASGPLTGRPMSRFPFVVR